MQQITGTMRYAGNVSVNGHKATGFFVETSGPDAMEAWARYMNRRVTISGDDNPAMIIVKRKHTSGPRVAFKRLEPVERFGGGSMTSFTSEYAAVKKVSAATGTTSTFIRR